jgi:26S proteasome regulatory subunit N3
LVAALDLEQQLGRIEKGVADTDLRYLWFVLRKNYTVRRELKPSLLAQCVEKRLPESELRTALLAWISQIPEPAQEMDEAADESETIAEGETDAEVESDATEAEAVTRAIPEVQIYLELLAVIFLVDNKLYAEVCFRYCCRCVGGLWVWVWVWVGVDLLLCV